MTKKSIELFAGAGGMALGLEKAGFEHIALIEWDKDAANTLKLNRPNWNVINEDISLISSLNLQKYFNISPGELSLISGGCPCQSFSYAGKRKGLEDTRGTLFYHFAEFLRQLQPKAFLFENVKGMLSHDNGKTFEIIKETFQDVGYHIQYRLLNAWDYNVPQKRERIIVVGIRKDLSDKISFTYPDIYEPKPLLKDALIGCPKSDGYEYSSLKKELFSYIPPGKNWTALPAEKAKAYMGKSYYSEGGKTGILRRLSWNEPSLTILTSPMQKQTERCHPDEIRPLTVRESARIQTFPDDWMFCGNLVSQYKQIGNAVPVNLAFAIGKELEKIMEI